MLRRFAEWCARGKIVSRRLPARFSRAPIFLSPDSQLKYWRFGSRAFDADLLALAETFVESTSVVWDVGSNCGVFALASAIRARQGYVLALEPDIWLAGIIRASARRNAAITGKIDVIPAALAGRVGLADFVIAQRGRATNALESASARGVSGGARERVLVPTLTLDVLLTRAPLPSLVKIDVEGAEVDVLSGGSQTLSEARPLFHIEVGAEAATDVFHMLERNDYLVFEAGVSLASQEPMRRCPWNTLAIPHEKLSATLARLAAPRDSRRS